MNAVQSKGLPLAGRKTMNLSSTKGHPDKPHIEPDVNGLPLSMVDQWQEYPTKRTFAVSVPTELRRRYYPNDAAFSQAMRKAGYVPVRTRKLTGKQSSFWLYRVTGNDKEVCTAEPAPRKASAPVVQTMTKPHPWFKRVALDGKWQHVYADHIHLLTKKRHRVDGVRVQGYSSTGLTVEVLA
ncbi:hypothetical protein ROS60_004856 [Pluralibacter gergoviae]|uniref:hypothetical protein n=1 Tax=Pluralibacter gergoviae TaxID=61647 RepID=UPI001FF190F7|nr:hypothetical protein [Pluralibacter gergoviae]ELG9932199.1 hypothetical protein [Pluralibacter gergoviae]ELK5596219.1 hypothetical protein [Pluralibacter gergoviae]MCK1068679.1 hypothetical protein [Pluralibacter gergoviae]MCV7761359.1 hypothetical protein [Pluralibacter gergoviae]HDS1115206.1 hypothetical protein [Pluralibacter gergoviae]